MDTLTYVSRDTMRGIANAIRKKAGTELLYKPTEMPPVILGLKTNSNTAVNFIDYDGTLLYGYTLEELVELTELPKLPEHDGLVCQGWNWTLEQLQAFNKPVTVGAKYITDDGATRLHIWIATEGRMTVPLCFTQSVNNGVTIDWGDGTTETVDGTDGVSTTYTYAEPGYYTIALTPQDGCEMGIGYTDDSGNHYGMLGSTAVANHVYLSMLQSVEIGSGVTSIGSYAFASCYSLTSVTILDGVTSIGSSAFASCYGMTEYHLKSTTPPTLSSTNVFTSIPSDCIIYVPAGCLEAYQTAINWSTYASYMQEESE